MTALSPSWQVPPCPAGFLGSCVREELSSLLPLQGAWPPTWVLFLLRRDHWCGKLSGQDAFCACDWHQVSDRHARFISPGSSSEKTSLCLVSLSCFLSLFSFLPLPCCYTPPPPRGSFTNTHLWAGKKNPKFDLRGFIFRDTRSDVSLHHSDLTPPPLSSVPSGHIPVEGFCQ